MSTEKQLFIEADDTVTGMYRLNSILHTIWKNRLCDDELEEVRSRLPTEENYSALSVMECSNGELVGFMRVDNQRNLSLIIEDQLYHINFSNNDDDALSRNTSPDLKLELINEEAHEFVLDYTPRQDG